MNARYTFEAFEKTASPASDRETAPDDYAPGLLPSAGCEVLTAATLENSTETGDSLLDVDDLFVPEHYEPNYAYPLIAWLTPRSGSNGRLQRLMRMVSERNYFGVSVPIVDAEGIEQQLLETFLSLRRQYHLHTERVYLLGFGQCGTLALQAGLSQPEWFAGIAAFSARWPDTPRLLSRYDDLRGKRVLLGIGETDSAPIVSDALYMQQLLWSAGMHVTARAASTGPEADRGLLREVDRWIMQAIEQPELVC